jgi:hypothetical protein
LSADFQESLVNFLKVGGIGGPENKRSWCWAMKLAVARSKASGGVPNCVCGSAAKSASSSAAFAPLLDHLCERLAFDVFQDKETESSLLIKDAIANDLGGSVRQLSGRRLLVQRGFLNT